MPSPFPGMNPYLEQDALWHDFHGRFIPLAAEMLGPRIAPKYVVRIEERIYVRELPAEEQRFLGRADVAVARRPNMESTRTGNALMAPARVQIPAVDVESLSFLEIRERKSRQVITVIELLSPSNKYSGPDREQYLGKRAQLLRSAVHFVEIDLLRGGPRMPLKDLPECDYYVMVSRVEDRPDAGVWPLRLRDPVPVVPIPLQAPDEDIAFDLRAVIDHIYDVSGYGLDIYFDESQPRLSAADAEWARQYIPASPS